MPDRSPTYHLAQINVSELKAPLDSPQLADFVAALEPVNALADAAPGFVWRLQTDDGNATSLRVFGDDRIIINMSVWASVEALHTFAYRGDHAGVLARRREWFEKLQEAAVALWWLPAGQLPSIEDAKYRLDHLRRHGPTPEAFTFRQRYDPPGVVAGQPDGGDPDGATARSSVTGAGATPSAAAAVGSTQSRAR